MRSSAWIPAALWMGFIFYSSSLPGSDIPSIFPFQDVVYHCIIYAILGFLVLRAFVRSGRQRTARTVFFAIIVCLVYGASDEFHQMFVPLRTASMFDWFVDGCGAVIGGILYR